MRRRVNTAVPERFPGALAFDEVDIALVVLPGRDTVAAGQAYHFTHLPAVEVQTINSAVATDAVPLLSLPIPQLS